ncbi:MAG: hypothetical protein V1743_07945 [Nanoarchaeota archaeon]
MAFTFEGRRKSNFFEKVLLIIGLGVIILGFHFILSIYQSGQNELWGMVSSIFLWLMLIVMIVLLATEEDVKEELAIIMKQQIEEVRLIREEVKLLKDDYRLMKDIENEEMAELRLIRKELEKQRYK